MPVGSSAASTIASTPRRLASCTIASPARRARTVAVATSTPSYSSPTALARASALRAGLELLLADARVERQRHRDLEHPERLDHRAALAGVLVLLAGEPPRGLHDVVVERGPEHGHEDRAELRLDLAPGERLGGDADPLEDRLALDGPVADIERDAEHQPAGADEAGGVVE